MNIVSLGEITIDHYRRQNRFYIGGISLNFAVHAKRSGAETVSLISCVGNRPVDAKIVELLDFEGVDHSHVAVLDGKTAECAIDVLENADRFFPVGGYHENVLSQLRLTDVDKAFINHHDIVVSMYDGPQSFSLVNQLTQMAKNGTKRVIDFGDWSNGRTKKIPAGFFEQIDLAFFSGDEDTLDYLHPISKTADCQFVLTMGAKGSLALTADGLIKQSSLPVERTIDSTGCGDAFQAAFTVCYFQNLNCGRDERLSRALEAGAKQAAIVLQHFGAFDQSPLDATRL